MIFLVYFGFAGFGGGVILGGGTLLPFEESRLTFAISFPPGVGVVLPAGDGFGSLMPMIYLRIVCDKFDPFHILDIQQD